MAMLALPALEIAAQHAAANATMAACRVALRKYASAVKRLFSLWFLSLVSVKPSFEITSLSIVSCAALYKRFGGKRKTPGRRLVFICAPA